jgi:TolA-binding protein
VPSGPPVADPRVAYNQGITFWNQNRVLEAQAQLQRAIDLDSRMADAHFWLGDGDHASIAQAMLAQIK